MYKIKNDPSLIAEEKTIYQEQEILDKQRIIPQDFVELVTHRKNYMCSTKDWKEPICERYGFTYEGKWKEIDIPQEFMEKLGLKLGENLPGLVFISPEVLDREPEQGGITLKNEKEILFAPLGSKLVREKGTQTRLCGESISGLEERMEKEVENLKKLNETLKVENDEKDLKIREVEEEVKKLKIKLRLWHEKWTEDKISVEVMENEIRTRLGEERLTKIKEKIKKLIERKKNEKKQEKEVQTELVGDKSISETRQNNEKLEVESDKKDLEINELKDEVKKVEQKNEKEKS